MEEVKDKLDDLRQENKRFCEEQDNIMKHLDKVKLRNKNKDKATAPSDRKCNLPLFEEIMSDMVQNPTGFAPDVRRTGIWVGATTGSI